MTEKQKERTKKKITTIKRELAADKRRWGGYYRDSRGLRYLPPELYLKLEDYSGAIRYYGWFQKNFPEDSGYPIFLFEWIVALFKTKRLEKAEKKAMETFAANTYLFDKFLDKEKLEIEKSENSNWESFEMTKYLKYSKDQAELKEFTEWLEKFVKSEKFYSFANTFIAIEKKLMHEPLGKKRTKLVKERYTLIENLKT